MRIEINCQISKEEYLEDLTEPSLEIPTSEPTLEERLQATEEALLTLLTMGVV